MSSYALAGSNPGTRLDPSGLAWVENLEGVVLPIVQVAEEAIGMGAIDALTQVYEGYLLMINIHALVQGAAFDAEEDLDWALDWDAPDEFNPRFQSSGEGYNLFAPVTGAGEPDGPAMGRIDRAPFNRLRARSVTSERWARTQYGASHCKRYVRDDRSSG